jgi:histone H3/H4
MDIEDFPPNTPHFEAVVPQEIMDPPEENDVSINLPVATVRKLVKEGAGDARFSPEALAGLSRACGVFLLYASLASQDVTSAKKKSTISADHVLTALAEIGFPEIAATLK